MSTTDVFNTGGHGMSEAQSWEALVDADPVRRWGALEGSPGGVIELDSWFTDHVPAVVHDAVAALAEQGDDARCSRDPGPQRAGQPWPGVHFAGFWLDESDSDDGVGPARWQWAPTLVRVLDPRGEHVELLCEGCAQAERDAAEVLDRCVPCWRGHHQGCGGEAVTDRRDGPSRWCACACRAPHQRVDPPEWAQRERRERAATS